MEQRIGELVQQMRKYQEKYKTKKQCLANTQYLYDVIRMNTNIDVKAKAVMVYSYDKDANETKIIIGHMVVCIGEETIIDPSYEVYNLKNVKYFDNIKTFVNSYNIKTSYDVKKIIEEHVTFRGLAERMNKDEIIIANRKYYDKIADYIENTQNKYTID